MPLLVLAPLDIEHIGAPHALGFGRSPGVVRGFGVGLGPGLGSRSTGTGITIMPVAGADAAGYRPAPLSEAAPRNLGDAASVRWVRRVVDTVNNSLRGKLNVTLNVTLAANADTTIVTDARISAFSALMFTPLTANAAAEQAAGGLYVTSQRSGEATVAHANNAQSDRMFRMVILA